MLMNKSLLFYILSMVGRQQARNGRKANLFIPQIRIYPSGRTKCSQHCQGPGHNPPSSGGSHWSWSHRDAPGSLPWSLRSSPSQNSLWVCFSFSLALSFCLPQSPKARCEHQTSNTSTVQRGLMPSDSTTESKEGLLGKSGASVWDILWEKGAGGMGGEGTAEATAQWQGMRQHPKGEAPGAATGGTLGSPKEPCPSTRSRSWAGGGAGRTGSCRAWGLAPTGTFALLWLLTFHLLQRVCCVNVYFAVWWLIPHPTPLISVHLTVRLLNNLLHKWVSIPQPPLPSPPERAMHSLWELCDGLSCTSPKSANTLQLSGAAGLGRRDRNCLVFILPPPQQLQEVLAHKTAVKIPVLVQMLGVEGSYTYWQRYACHKSYPTQKHHRKTPKRNDKVIIGITDGKILLSPAPFPVWDCSVWGRLQALDF